MSYAFGWWDFVEIDGEPQMVCRDSDERVVMVGDLEEPWLAKAIAEHPKRPSDRWKRFEYRHDEFWFPLIVNWVPEEGHVLVDYNLSSELWRIETNAETEYPPYGGWVRVDDMVPDAFWCWPGVLEARYAKEPIGQHMPGDHAIKYFFKGGWYQDSWSGSYFALQMTKRSKTEQLGHADYNLSSVEYDVACGFQTGPLVYLPRLEFPQEGFARFEKEYSQSKFFKRCLTSLTAAQNASWSLLVGNYHSLRNQVHQINQSFKLPEFDARYAGIIDEKTNRTRKIVYGENKFTSNYSIILNRENGSIIQYLTPNLSFNRDFVYYKPENSQLYFFTISKDSLNTDYREVSFSLGHITTFRDQPINEFFGTHRRIRDIENTPETSFPFDHPEIILECDEYLLIQREIAEAFYSYAGFTGNNFYTDEYVAVPSYFNSQVDIVETMMGILGGRYIVGRTKLSGALEQNFSDIKTYNKSEVAEKL